MIKLQDLEFKPYLKQNEIECAIDDLCTKLSNDLSLKKPLFLVVLNGAFMFASEVSKRFVGDAEFSFIKLSSYEGTETTNSINEILGLDQEVKDRTVVILEDIVDTGNTVEFIVQDLKEKRCKDIRIATLFFKPEVYAKNLKIDYVGASIPNKFIVGYGLDYNGLGRNLTDVYQLKTDNNMTNLVLFGPPGAGKGTQAEVLKEKYDLIHISTGDVFRYNIKNETELGKLAKSYIDKGQLVPDEVTIKMLSEEVDKNPKAKGFIFDGFPRTEAQADALAELLKTKNTEVSGMVALEVDDEILVQRLLNRGKTSGRADDADENVIRNRIKVYYNETAILKDYYLKQNKYHGIDGVGTIEEITERLSKAIDKL